MPVRVPGHFWLPKVQKSDFRGGRNKRVCKGKSICYDTCSTWYCRCTGFLGLPELLGRCSKCNWQSWWWWPRGKLCSGIRRNGYIRWCESCLPCLFNDEHPCWWRTVGYPWGVMVLIFGTGWRVLLCWSQWVQICLRPLLYVIWAKEPIEKT